MIGWESAILNVLYFLNSKLQYKVASVTLIAKIKAYCCRIISEKRKLSCDQGSVKAHEMAILLTCFHQTSRRKFLLHFCILFLKNECNWEFFYLNASFAKWNGFLC